ncbi:hypothetical protein [Komagataeibacter xylinus]|uniref:hypothetical protein n=1 Tax=Komagataeibacter xylinus TaxID=28448 RepID=UPI001013D3A1|nr:hypothetical protein [Komagataeibacter xylinus]
MRDAVRGITMVGKRTGRRGMSYFERYRHLHIELLSHDDDRNLPLKWIRCYDTPGIYDDCFLIDWAGSIQAHAIWYEDNNLAIQEHTALSFSTHVDDLFLHMKKTHEQAQFFVFTNEYALQHNLFRLEGTPPFAKEPGLDINRIVKFMKEKKKREEQEAIENKARLSRMNFIYRITTLF